MPFEFTERMKAIARGEDPDAIAVADKPVESAVAVTTEPVAAVVDSEIPDDGEAGTDASLTAGSKDAAPESGSEPTEVVAETPAEVPAKPVESWRDNDVKSLAKSYGFTDDELNEFGSKAEFTRATRLIDRQLVARRPVEPVEKPVAPQVETPAEKQASLVDRMKAKGFDEDSIEIAKQLELQSRQLQEITHRSRLAESQRQADYFHSVVDGMSEKRFGRTVDAAGRSVQLNESTNENRRKLYEAAETIAAGINARAQQLGRQVSFPPVSEIMRQAEAMAFADEIRAEERATLVKQVAAQSKNRRPVAGSRPTAGGGALPKPTNDDNTEALVARVKAEWRERTA